MSPPNHRPAPEQGSRAVFVQEIQSIAKINRKSDDLFGGFSEKSKEYLYNITILTNFMREYILFPEKAIDCKTNCETLPNSHSTKHKNEVLL